MNTQPAPCFDNDIWYLDTLGIPIEYYKYSYSKSINFSNITHPWLNKRFKEYILFLIQQNYAISGILSKISYMAHFNKFIELKHIMNLKNFTHKDTPEFIHFINSIHSTTHFISSNLFLLSQFIEWGAWMYPEEFPVTKVIYRADQPKKIRKEPKYYTKTELEKIKSVLRYTDKMTARLTLIMMYHGLRFADITKTFINIGGQSCLTQNSDGQYIFSYYISKTNRYNRIPVSEGIAKIIQAQINSTKHKFGNNCNILFAFEKDKIYVYICYKKKMDLLFKSHNITYDDGRPLRINTRLFRSSYATELINAGASPDTVRAMLGHKEITTQTHYARIHGKTMLSLLTPMTNQDNDLIARIGNVTESMCHVPDDYSDFIPLPNGACTCNGNCPHQNACYTCNFYVPQKRYLPTYKLQLDQAELAISEAKKYNHTTFIEKNVTLCNALKTIISTLEVSDETGQDGRIPEDP